MGKLGGAESGTLFFAATFPAGLGSGPETPASLFLTRSKAKSCENRFGVHGTSTADKGKGKRRKPAPVRLERARGWLENISMMAAVRSSASASTPTAVGATAAATVRTTTAATAAMVAPATGAVRCGRTGRSGIGTRSRS
jgi:hypothetical protein